MTLKVSKKMLMAKINQFSLVIFHKNPTQKLSRIDLFYFRKNYLPSTKASITPSLTPILEKPPSLYKF